jgi:hypothetical protein
MTVVAPCNDATKVLFLSMVEEGMQAGGEGLEGIAILGTGLPLCLAVVVYLFGELERRRRRSCSSDRRRADIFQFLLEDLLEDATHRLLGTFILVLGH